MKTTLAIDSATGPCSVAITRGAEVLAHIREEANVQQAKRLVPMIEKALQHAKLNYADLSQIITTIGPGGFTGLRIGLATARAIGFSTSITVHGVTTLATLAVAAAKGAIGLPLITVLNAGKGDVFWQQFGTIPLHAQSEAELCKPQDMWAKINAAEFAIAGYEKALETAPKNAHIISGFSAPDALFASQLPEAFYLPPEPFYIRPPDAILPVNAFSVK